MLLVTHGVELRGNRYYMASTSVEHPEFPPQKTIQRAQFGVSSNYFEATADNLGVKNTFVFSITGKGVGAGSISGSTTQTTLHNHIKSIQSLRKLLEKRIELDE